MLHKINHIILIVACFISFTEVRQCLRIPIYIMHYHEHKHLDPNLNLFEYTLHHYVKNLAKDADFATDMNLPFRSIPASIQVPLFTLLYQNSNDFSPFVNRKTDVFNNLLTESYRYIFNQTIWHPPQM
jgi:hypothetical protein